MLSKSSTYALRSIVFIAHAGSIESKLSLKEIAEELELPLHYLGKILQQLSKNSIIQSIKGPNGGFYLDNTSTPLISVIEVIDGLDFFNRCGLGFKECSEEHPCVLHNEFKVHRDGLWSLFSTTTIADLVTKIEDGDAFIRNLSNETS